LKYWKSGKILHRLKLVCGQLGDKTGFKKRIERLGGAAKFQVGLRVRVRVSARFRNQYCCCPVLYRPVGMSLRLLATLKMVGVYLRPIWVGFYMPTLVSIYVLLFRHHPVYFSATVCPVFKDVNTPSPFVEEFPAFESCEGTNCASAALPDHIYMDAMAFGMGCCCLQMTFQACNICEARHLYDQLTPMCPIMVRIFVCMYL